MFKNYVCVYLIPSHICELIAKLSIQTEEVRELLTVLTLPGGTEGCSPKVGLLYSPYIVWPRSDFRISSSMCRVNSPLDVHYDQQLVNK